MSREDNPCPCCGLTVIHTGGCIQCPDPACGWIEAKVIIEGYLEGEKKMFELTGVEIAIKVVSVFVIIGAAAIIFGLYRLIF